MELATCGNCLSEVVPTASGQCPCCRKPFVALRGPAGFADSPFKASIKPPIAIDASRPGESSDPFATANPYQAPSASAEELEHPVAAPRARGGIVWMLFSIEGRIGRASFWGYSLLVTFCYYLVIGGLTVAADSVERGAAGRDAAAGALFLVIGVPIAIVFFWATIAIQVKRWHDHDMSGWWWFLSLLPIVGPIVAFVLLGFIRGTIGRNRFGADPT
jgi:uncharacterized membrane protein YhaH (DUF805 family)